MQNVDGEGILRPVSDYLDADDTDATEDEFDQALAASEPVVVYSSQADYLLAQQLGFNFVGLSENCICVLEPALDEQAYLLDPLVPSYAAWTEVFPSYPSPFSYGQPPSPVGSW